MNKLKEGIDSGYFLVISHWAGLSLTPGSTGMFVYPDGKYLLKRTRFDLNSDNKDEKITTKEGRLSAQELQDIKDYVEKNISVSSHHTIFDAGQSVEVVKNGNIVEIENDEDIYNRISDLLNFKEKCLEL